MNYVIQTDKEKYSSGNYLTSNRLSTYYMVINEIIGLKPHKVLEVGPGNYIVTDILEKMGICVKTLDFDETLSPDYVCDIADYENLPDEKFDCIIASQVFEHIKYSDFINSLKKLRENANYLILTLPFTSRHSLFFHFSFYLPLIKNVVVSYKIIYKRIPHIFNGQHYWEIGKKGNQLSKVKKDILNAGWRIKKKYINHKNPYHYFFILK